MEKAYKRIITIYSSMKYLIIILAFFLNVCQAKPGGHSGERVHIRLHMPEVVRQHTHFHKVYKYAKKLPPPPPPVAPSPSHPIIGKPHVSLLGYTTAAAGSSSSSSGSPGSGGVGIGSMLSPSIMHLMANAQPTMMTPTLMPNYGPALFDNFNQDFKEPATTTSTTMRTPIAGYTSPSSSASSAFSSSAASSSAKQKLLEQIFTPNLMAAINAAAAVQEMNSNDDRAEAGEPLEKNSLLNQNFLDALQREYLSKFGGRRKRKKSHTKNYHLPSRPTTQYYNIQDNDDDDLNETFEDYPDEQYEEMKPQSQKMYSNNDWNYYRDSESEPDLDDGNAYDSAVAFSGQDNMLSSMPTVDEFFDESPSSSSSGGKPYYGDLYDSYASTELSGPTTSTTTPWSHHHSPTSWGSSSSSTRPFRTHSAPSKSRYRPSKIRYVKSTTTTTRKKRKNRFKRYRI